VRNYLENGAYLDYPFKELKKLGGASSTVVEVVPTR
jgi:hypothetical protein